MLGGSKICLVTEKYSQVCLVIVFRTVQVLRHFYHDIFKIL